jgi:hypothetical protein
MIGFRLALAVALSLALCACGGAPPASADEKPQPPVPSAPTGTARTVARLEDQYGVTIEVTDPVFFRPASGILGGKGSKLKELRIWQGAFETTISLPDVERIDVTGKNEGDLVPVRVTMRDGSKLEGKVERDLEIQGRVRNGTTSIRFDRLRSVALRTS